MFLFMPHVPHHVYVACHEQIIFAASIVLTGYLAGIMCVATNALVLVNGNGQYLLFGCLGHTHAKRMDTNRDDRMWSEPHTIHVHVRLHHGQSVVLCDHRGHGPWVDLTTRPVESLFKGAQGRIGQKNTIHCVGHAWPVGLYDGHNGEVLVFWNPPDGNKMGQNKRGHTRLKSCLIQIGHIQVRDLHVAVRKERKNTEEKTRQRKKIVRCE